VQTVEHKGTVERDLEAIPRFFDGISNQMRLNYLRSVPIRAISGFLLL
jgi:hypothetical protein